MFVLWMGSLSRVVYILEATTLDSALVLHGMRGSGCIFSTANSLRFRGSVMDNYSEHNFGENIIQLKFQLNFTLHKSFILNIFAQHIPQPQPFVSEFI